jgi:hypothetical protein
MLQRQDDVGGAGRGRQRRNQRADERSAALDSDRGNHHDGRGHHHLEQQPVPEGHFHRHAQSLSSPESTPADHRSPMDERPGQARG